MAQHGWLKPMKVWWADKLDSNFDAEIVEPDTALGYYTLEHSVHIHIQNGWRPIISIYIYI